MEEITIFLDAKCSSVGENSFLIFVTLFDFNLCWWLRVVVAVVVAVVEPVETSPSKPACRNQPVEITVSKYHFSYYFYFCLDAKVTKNQDWILLLKNGDFFRENPQTRAEI